MDFLESAAILIPPLTGSALTIYHGDQDTLVQFEHQYCFSPQIQRIYTAAGMRAFFETGSEDFIYELTEPLGSHLIVAKTGADWILLGPFVTDEWNERSSRSLLIKLGISGSMALSYKLYRCKLPVLSQEFSLKTATLMIRQLDNVPVNRRIEPVLIDMDGRDTNLGFMDAYEDISVTNRRYQLEMEFIQAISAGDIVKVYEALNGMGQVGGNIRFVSDRLTDHVALASSMRSDARMAAMFAGLSPVLIDSISQECAQKIKQAGSRQEIVSLMMRYIERICAEIRDMRSSNYSMVVRKAVDYMEVNLSNPMDSAEIAKAVGVDRRLLVQTFGKETGMTIKQYLAKSRCKIAADLLRSSRFSIQAIAAYVGYSDNNYFTKVFKANQGVSPRDYRKAHWPSE